MYVAALLVASLLAADPEAPASATVRPPPANLVLIGINLYHWPALDRSVWVDQRYPDTPPGRFGGSGPTFTGAYRRDAGSVGSARVLLGGTLAFLYERASGGTSVTINGSPSSLSRHITSRMMYATADVRLQRAASRWRPFAEGGVGWYLEDVSTQLSDGMVEDTYFRANRLGGWLGAGLDVALWEFAVWDVRLSLAGRVHFVDFGMPGSRLVQGGSLGGPIYELVPAIGIGLF